MITIRLFSPRARVCFILFASFALAALQNVTVDDAVLTGTVVPGYLPSPSNWAQGNDCSGCLAKPDPSLAYNGTWHDTTFHPDSTVYPAFQFTFVGSGLYIFFILANNLGVNVTSLTNVNFILDNVQVSSFLHQPTASTDYLYNQTVFANNSIPYGQHTMTVAPVNDSVDSVLILFDYLVYTTDTDTATATTTNTVSSSFPTSSGLPTTSGPNIGAVVGGTVGGVAGLGLVALSAICYYRYRRRPFRQSSPDTNVVEPFVSPPQAPVTSSHATSLSVQQVPIGSPPTQPRPGHKTALSASLASVQPSDPPSTLTPSLPSSASRSRGDTEILEQVGMLRNEVARLRCLQDVGWNGSEPRSELPPEYS